MRNTDDFKTMAAWERIHNECWYKGRTVPSKSVALALAQEEAE